MTNAREQCTCGRSKDRRAWHCKVCWSASYRRAGRYVGACNDCTAQAPLYGGRCKPCYDRAYVNSKRTTCGGKHEIPRPHYGHGLCASCYVTLRRKAQRELGACHRCAAMRHADWRSPADERLCGTCALPHARLADEDAAA